MRKILFFMLTVSVALNSMAQLNYQKIHGTQGCGEFGKRVMIEGDIACGGETYFGGSVEVFRNIDGVWVNEQRLTGSNAFFGLGTAYIGSGTAIEIENEHIFIGEWGYTDGNVFVYGHDGTEWVLEQTIYHSDGYFGKNLTVDGNLMVVNSNSGIHQYKYDGSLWVLENSITGLNSNYGQNLLLKDSLLLVKSNADSEFAPNNGAVLLYEYTGTSLDSIQKISVSTLDTNAWFGGAMAMEDDMIVIGAEGDAANGEKVAGRVFMFTKINGTWELTDSLMSSSSPIAQDRFGCQVAIYNGEIYVGENAWGANEGRVQKFVNDGTSWNATEIKPIEVGVGDYYSRSMAFDGKNLIVGAHFDDDMGSNDGAAYIIDMCSTFAPEQEYELCAGESVIINGTSYNSTTSFEERIPNAAGCDSIIIHNITVHDLPTVVANSDVTEVCAGESVTLYGSGASTYSWDNAVADNVAFIPTETLTYTVTGNDGNCENTATINISYYPLPVVIAYRSMGAICEGEEVTLYGGGNASSYTWDNGVQDNVAFVPTDLGVTTYTVTGTNAHCEASDDITVTVNEVLQVSANATETEICAGEEITLTGSGSIIYSWDNDVEDNVAFAPSETTTFTVTGTDGLCEDEAQITIIVNDLPSVVANADMTEICEGESVTLYGSGATSFIWDNGVVDNTTFTPTETLVYTVTGSDGICENSDQIEVAVTPLPVQPSIIMYGENLMSSATVGNQWYYTTIQLPGENNQILTPQSDGLYYVEVTVDGCSSMSEAYNYSTVGLNDLNAKSLTVYPTAAKSYLHVNLDEMPSEAYTLKIIDITGKVHYSTESTEKENTINVQNLTQGVYFLNFNNNTETKIIKWIKE
jgi:hypothetical protein